MLTKAKKVKVCEMYICNCYALLFEAYSQHNTNCRPQLETWYKNWVHVNNWQNDFNYKSSELSKLRCKTVYWNSTYSIGKFWNLCYHFISKQKHDNSNIKRFFNLKEGFFLVFQFEKNNDNLSKKTAKW